MDNKVLSCKSHWDSLYQADRLRIIDPAEHPYSELAGYYDRLLRALIGKKGRIKIMEIGCGASRWLAHFKANYDCDVYGIDYSEKGIEQIKGNFEALGLSGEFHVQDFFDLPDGFQGRFDVVFSVGFLEHFSNTSEVLGLMKRMAAEDGVVVNHIPNLRGICGAYSERFQLELYRMHKTFELRDLESALQDAGLANIEVKYLGGYWPHVINWSVLDDKYVDNLYEKICRKAMIKLYKLIRRVPALQADNRFWSSQIIMSGYNA